MREIQKLYENWHMSAACVTDWSPDAVEQWEAVCIPHVWNKKDAAQEGARLYKRDLLLEQPGTQRQYFLAFDAVAGVCKAWLNGQLLGEHRGGYARFCFALGDAAKPGTNELLVLADNTHYDDLIPLGGDFNNYGGIYRDVELICVGQTHFDLLHYGTCGLNLTPAADGTVTVTARTAGATGQTQVEYTILHGDAPVARATCAADGAPVVLKVEHPILWNGQGAAHLYTCRARLLCGGSCVDEVALPFGFRSVAMTADKGFFLNGEHLLLRGVAKHQDFAGYGCAPGTEQLDQDMALIREIGANAVRLSHYQHPQYFYDLCDKEGLVVWAEIPMLTMQDGNDALQENACQQLTELILQCKHHPSICFWGIQNEIAMMGESLEMYRKTQALHALAKTLDASRITAGANLYCVKNNSQLNHITDMVGYNIYFGWYYGELEEYASFFDKFSADNPHVPLGVSEYGVDCSVTLHADTPRRKDYSEEFQCLYHETVYPMIRARTHLWGSFVWNMFDFGSAIRNEGGVKGKNCKGLVTFDRAVKKDAFYFYKAWWSNQPFVYLAGHRFEKRCAETTTIKVYSNLKEVTLTVNDKAVATKTGEHVFVFEHVPLCAGDNMICAYAQTEMDKIVLKRTAQPEQSYVYVDPNPEFNVKNWFTLEQSQDDLFPEGRYSIMDEMGALSENPQVWALLETEVPQITDNPRSRSMPSMTLLRIINRISGQFTEEFVKQLNSKLNAIAKP